MCGTSHDRRKDLFMIIKFSSNSKKSTILLFKCANFFCFCFCFCLQCIQNYHNWNKRWARESLVLKYLPCSLEVDNIMSSKWVDEDELTVINFKLPHHINTFLCTQAGSWSRKIDVEVICCRGWRRGFLGSWVYWGFYVSMGAQQSVKIVNKESVIIYQRN